MGKFNCFNAEGAEVGAQRSRRVIGLATLFVLFAPFRSGFRVSGFRVSVLRRFRLLGSAFRPTPFWGIFAGALLVEAQQLGVPIEFADFGGIVAPTRDYFDEQFEIDF